MSSFTVIRLDTSAPVVTWGDPVDAVASELLTVPYAVDEPGVEWAEIELRDGRVLPMAVAPTALTVELPDDAPEGAATVRAEVVDDVGNRATRSLVLYVTGVIPVEEPVRRGGGLPRPPEQRVSSTPSGVATDSRWTVGAIARSSSVARMGSTYALPTLSYRTTSSEVQLGISWSVAASSTPTATGAATGGSAAIQRRPEGPRHEEELILLGLI